MGSSPMSQAEALPQLDATSLLDGERLEAAVKDMYRHVALEEDAEARLRARKGLAEHLGYTGELLAALQAGEELLDLESGSGTDVFCAAVLVGESGRGIGVDITDEQRDKAARLREGEGFL
jgi:arsenite methyltransferase